MKSKWLKYSTLLILLGSSIFQTGLQLKAAEVEERTSSSEEKTTSGTLESISSSEMTTTQTSTVESTTETIPSTTTNTTSSTENAQSSESSQSTQETTYSSEKENPKEKVPSGFTGTSLYDPSLSLEENFLKNIKKYPLGLGSYFNVIAGNKVTVNTSAGGGQSVIGGKLISFNGNGGIFPAIDSESAEKFKGFKYPISYGDSTYITLMGEDFDTSGAFAEETLNKSESFANFIDGKMRKYVINKEVKNGTSHQLMEGAAPVTLNKLQIFQDNFGNNDSGEYFSDYQKQLSIVSDYYMDFTRYVDDNVKETSNNTKVVPGIKAVFNNSIENISLNSITSTELNFNIKLNSDVSEQGAVVLNLDREKIESKSSDVFNLVFNLEGLNGSEKTDLPFIIINWENYNGSDMQFSWNSKMNFFADGNDVSNKMSSHLLHNFPNIIDPKVGGNYSEGNKGDGVLSLNASSESPFNGSMLVPYGNIYFDNASLNNKFLGNFLAGGNIYIGSLLNLDRTFGSLFDSENLPDDLVTTKPHVAFTPSTDSINKENVSEDDFSDKNKTIPVPIQFKTTHILKNYEAAFTLNKTGETNPLIEEKISLNPLKTDDQGGFTIQPNENANSNDEYLVNFDLKTLLNNKNLAPDKYDLTVSINEGKELPRDVLEGLTDTLHFTVYDSGTVAIKEVPNFEFTTSDRIQTLPEGLNNYYGFTNTLKDQKVVITDTRKNLDNTEPTFSSYQLSAQWGKEFQLSEKNISVTEPILLDIALDGATKVEGTNKYLTSGSKNEPVVWNVNESAKNTNEQEEKTLLVSDANLYIPQNSLYVLDGFTPNNVYQTSFTWTLSNAPQ